VSSSSRYLVTVQLMESYWPAAGSRVFTMRVDGVVAATIDIFQQAGGQKWTNTSYTATAIGSTMKVEFVAVPLKDQPQVRGGLHLATNNALSTACIAALSNALLH
jgi:Malectin domain